MRHDVRVGAATLDSEPDAARARPRGVRAGGLVVGALVLCLLAWLLAGGGGTGDPGGLVLGKLQAAQQAVPPGASVTYRHFDEPTMDACDGNPSIRGWSDVSVLVGFDTAEPPADVVRTVDDRLGRVGWSGFRAQTDNGEPGGAWQRSLANGSVARAKLTAGPGGESDGKVVRQWELSAFAPPVGQRAGGC